MFGVYQVQILCENQQLLSVAHTSTHLAVLDSACIENEIPCGPELPQVTWCRYSPVRLCDAAMWVPVMRPRINEQEPFGSLGSPLLFLCVSEAQVSGVRSQRHPGIQLI